MPFGALPGQRRAHHGGAVSLLLVPPRQCRTGRRLSHVRRGAGRLRRPSADDLESSPGARRGFCPACGTQISFTADSIPGLIDLTIGSLDDPASVPPAMHSWNSRRLPWFDLADDLPRHAEFPPPP